MEKDDLLSKEWSKKKSDDLTNHKFIRADWITDRMPSERKHTSDTLQGRREWTESDLVLAWDSVYGARIDSTRNGKWKSESKCGYQGQICHGIIAWMPLPPSPEETN